MAEPIRRGLDTVTGKVTGNVSGTGSGTGPDDPVEAVRRWESAGGVWRVLADDGDRVTVGLFSCTGGELMQEVSSADPRLRASLGGQVSSEG